MLYRYDFGISLDDLVRETRRVVAGWNWNRGAFGHALSLPAYRDLHPFARYSYPNFPCTGLLARCPVFRELFDRLRCEKTSFRLLRRAPATSYGWHTDLWKGAGVVRFQIPILSDPGAFLVTTDYTREDQVIGARALTAASFGDFADANAGHFLAHHLEPGRLHYFDTTRVHTLVNPGPSERITLSFDLVANDWVRKHFPDVRVEIGDQPTAPLPRGGPTRNGLAFLRSRFYPLRNRVRGLRHPAAEH